VRLIHPSAGERNYHVFYQFLASATQTERRQFFLGNKEVKDFKLLSQTSTYDRRDGVSDSENHQEMLDAMVRSKNIFSFVFHMSTLQNN
jgi:myosin heavy subunit